MKSSPLSPRTQEKALATPRRPCSPEGRCARGRPQHVSAASYGRPEHILPGHLGPVGAQRGGRRHAASIWGSRRPSSTHGRVAPRPTIWRRTDAPRPRIRTRLRRAAGHRPAPHRATTALQHEARSRHNIEPRRRESSPPPPPPRRHPKLPKLLPKLVKHIPKPCNRPYLAFVPACLPSDTGRDARPCRSACICRGERSSNAHLWVFPVSRLLPCRVRCVHLVRNQG